MSNLDRLPTSPSESPPPSMLVHWLLAPTMHLCRWPVGARAPTWAGFTTIAYGESPMCWPRYVMASE